MTARPIRRKADASISSKDFYAIYRLWCEENSLASLKSRSFSDAMVANAKKFNLEHCNNITNSAGRRVWGFMGVEAVARPNINGFYDVSPCTYRRNGRTNSRPPFWYVCTQRFTRCSLFMRIISGQN